MRDVSDIDDAFTEELIARIAMCFNEAAALWSLEERAEAAQWIRKHMGPGWTVNDLYSKFGNDAIDQRMAAVWNDRHSLMQAVSEIVQMDGEK
jgi:hypothetical protein